MAKQPTQDRPLHDRHLHEVVELTKDCELGEKGERAVVIKLVHDGYWFMTLLFPNREIKHTRTANTGADYKFLRSV